ncbi:MAG: VWA domain-containing protein [Bacteroidota bacterium]
MSFQHPEYLIALSAIPVMVLLYFFYVKWKKQTIKKIGNPVLVQQLISDYSPRKFLIKFCLFAVAFAVIVLALANPRKPSGASNVKRNGIDVMIALDVSKSMLAQDVQPNRLERAKQLISKLIDKMPNDRVGIVVFAGRAYLQMPLTPDLVAAKLYLSTASPDVVPTQGTVIGDALKMCYASFNAKEKKYKSIILISDGEDHDETAEKLSRSLAEEGVMVNTVGIGSAEGATIDDPVTGEHKKDAEGKIVITKLNETELRNIAAATGGVYKLFTSTDEVADAIESQLKTMGQRSITETSLVNYQNYYPYLLGLALLLLLIEFFMSEKKSTRKEKSNQPAMAVLLLFILSVPAISFSQNTNQLVNAANDLYKEKKYSEAITAYKKIIEKKPANATAQYNLGNALYKNKNNEDAIKAYEQAIVFSKDNKEKGEAFYNKGVILQNDKKLPECIEAYKKALKLNPADEDARLNLQKALQQQKKQEQPKDDKQKKKDKKQQPQPPKPQQNKMTKKEAEEKLKALLQQEKNLQDKLKKTDANTLSKPEKDW